MASCGGLQQIFENRALPEKPTLIESLAWNQIKSINDPSNSSPSFTEIFGELHFKEIQHHHHHSTHPSSPSPSSSSSTTRKTESSMGGSNSSTSSSSSTHAHHHHQQQQQHHLQLCTEGLGFESFDDVEEMKSESSSSSRDDQPSSPSLATSVFHKNYKYGQFERPRSGGSSSSVIKSFPPPISCIGRSGKPWICFKSYRQDGRFVLKEVRIPTQEFLHACRADGRLRLHLVQPDEEEQQPRDQQNDDHDGDDQASQDKGDGEEDEKIDQSSKDEANS